MSQPPPAVAGVSKHSERFELTTLWEMVRDCRARIAKTFGYLEPEVVEALAIVVSELAENVVKYAVLDSAAPPVMTVQVTRERIVVRAENLVRSDYDARLACRLIEKAMADLAERGPEEAYALAIQTNLSQKSQHSRQGFHRIAAVARFRLRAERDGKKLIIIGERAL
jgi:anti-sigma regulatory factor (Ser/Thr protein kinase)